MTARLVPLLMLLAATIVAADPVQDFSLPDLRGKQHTLGEYRGKWVIINFWATNCAPCLKEIPELEDFYRRHKDSDAVVLGVNYEDIKRSWLKDFLASVKMSYPVLLAEPDQPTAFGSVKVLPTTVIVSPAGQVSGIHQGAVSAKILDDFIRERETLPADRT